MIGLSSKYKYLLDEIKCEKERREEWDDYLIKRTRDIENRLYALLDHLGLEEKETQGITFVKKESKK